jgi:hypothetical protein
VIIVENQGDAGQSPVGEGDYTVREGECLSSIADATGHFWRRLWDLPANQALKAARADPNVLLPGDRVTVPPLVTKQLEADTGRRHRYRRRGVPEIFHLRFLDPDGRPRAGLSYVLEVGDRTLEGVTDGEGRIEQWIPPGAMEATLTLENEKKRPEIYRLQIGSLDPGGSEAGARARLGNLGFLPDEDAEDADYRKALRAFQIVHDLPATGTLDQKTQAALVQAHGS